MNEPRIFTTRFKSLGFSALQFFFPKPATNLADTLYCYWWWRVIVIYHCRPDTYIALTM